MAVGDIFSRIPTTAYKTHGVSVKSWSMIKNRGVSVKNHGV